MDLGLKAKNAIIFGASSGLGRAAAHSLASEGCNTTLIARDSEKLKTVSKEILTSTQGNLRLYCGRFNERS